MFYSQYFKGIAFHCGDFDIILKFTKKSFGNTMTEEYLMPLDFACEPQELSELGQPRNTDYFVQPLWKRKAKIEMFSNVEPRTL
jgi:hypothetical protein